MLWCLKILLKEGVDIENLHLNMVMLHKEAAVTQIEQSYIEQRCLFPAILDIFLKLVLTVSGKFQHFI